MEALFKQFDNFIKRSFIPSTTFIMFFLLFDILLNEELFLKFLREEHSTMIILITLLIFISFSNLLSIINQYIYDDKIKGDYNGKYCFTHNNIELIRLRFKIKTQLQKNNLKDYSIYQIIGKAFKTERYVDEAKSIGITFLSILLVSLLSIIQISIIYNKYWAFLLILIPIIYLIGFELIKSRYRSRAIRIYTNYLFEIKKGEPNE